MCRGTKNAETHLFGPVPAFLSFLLYYFVFYTILFIFVHLLSLTEQKLPYNPYLLLPL